jgi:hypothetical protein
MGLTTQSLSHLSKTSMNMNWFTWALLSAFFAGLTAALAKVGVAHVNST